MARENIKPSVWLKQNLKNKGKKIILKNRTSTTTNSTATTTSGKLTLTALIQIFEEKNSERK